MMRPHKHPECLLNLLATQESPFGAVEEEDAKEYLVWRGCEEGHQATNTHWQKEAANVITIQRESFRGIRCGQIEQLNKECFRLMTCWRIMPKIRRKSLL